MLTDAETQLDDIAREETELRQRCNVIDAQQALADAYAAHLTEARLMLQRLQDRLTEVEQTNDQTTKRHVIELLVHSIRIDTHADVTHGENNVQSPCVMLSRRSV